MGAWGKDIWENDVALDWVFELEEASDWNLVEAALRGASDTSLSAHLDAELGQIACAAAAVFAAVDDPTIALPSEVSDWLGRFSETRPETLRPLAVQALERVLGARSELDQLWREAGEQGCWRGNVEKIAASLGQVAGPGDADDQERLDTPDHGGSDGARESGSRGRAAMALVDEGCELGRHGRYQEAITVLDRVEEYSSDPAAGTRLQVARALFVKGRLLARHAHPSASIRVFDLLVTRYDAAAEPEIRALVATALVDNAHNLGRLHVVDGEIRFYERVVEEFGDASEPAIRLQVARALMSKGLRLGALNRSEETTAAYDAVESKFAEDTEPSLRRLTASFVAAVVERFDDVPDPSLRALARRARADAERRAL